MAHPEGILPYRNWMGLTRKEYRDLNDLMARADTWGQRVVGTGEISATSTDGREAVFDASGHLAPLNDVRIDLRELTVDTPAGSLTDAQPLQADGAAGRLDGFHWTRDAGAVTFDIAIIEGTDQCFLQFVSGEVTATGASLTIRYAQSQ